MGVITTGSFGKALWPGINAFYGMAYKEWPEIYTKLFEKHKSTKRFEEDVSASGFGLAQEISEGGSVSYDTAMQGFVSRYNHVRYGLGFVITRDMVEDDLYDVIGQKRAKALAKSIRQTKETIAANVYNRAFNSSYTGGDGKELCATDHPNAAGGTYKNELTTAADLSEAALEQAFIDIGKWTDDRGLQAAFSARSLVIPVDLQFDAYRILNSMGRVGTADNDVNAIKGMGMLPDGIVVSPYLEDSDAWFLLTNATDGMKYFERVADSFAMDNDFDTDNAKFKATFRCSFGWSDPKGVFGSPGA